MCVVAHIEGCFVIDMTDKILITEDFLNRNGERAGKDYELAFGVKEWILHRVKGCPVARVVWSLVADSITVVAYSACKRDARIMGAKYIDEIETVLNFCGYDDVVKNFKY